jgi:translocation and assembly module TamB
LTDAEPETAAAEGRPAPPRRRGPPRSLAAIVVIVAIVALAGAVLRFGALTPWGLRVIEAELDSFNIGAYGRLHVEGLEGDVWRDFSVRRLTMSDVHGTWLDARGVRVRWDWPRLFSRQLWFDEVDAVKLTLLRRPTPKATGGGGSPGVSLHLGKLAARTELMPAFSDRYGLYDVTGALELRRQGGLAGRLDALSLTHAGDAAHAVFDLGRDKTVALSLTAREADGGAIAGSFGLAANQPFSIEAHASGTTSQGQYTITSRSGALTPIEGAGAWTPRGGEAHGRITLAASRFLTGYQGMLGPQAAFEITGARAADGFEAIALTANSENVDLTARGEADLGRRASGPKGLAVTIFARQAQRILHWPAMGAGRFAGTFATQPGGWKLAGPVTIEAPNGLGYRLAQASGPAELDWRNGEMTLKAALDGAGGQGSGLVAALLGGRPHAASEIAWLPGGHVLVRSLTLEGPGLKVTGTGDRGLLGGLSFKGQASFSNFAAAKVGAKGLMTTSWTATQGGEAPWTFGFDATAKGLATTYAELDRLLGAAPTLKGQAVWDGHAFQISQANLTGAAASATGSGSIGGDGALAFKLGWRATGPFEVGPLEIAGAADGAGDLSGTLVNPRADLSANIASIDLPQLRLTAAHATLSFLKGPSDTNGAFALTASSPYGPAHIDTGFRFVADGVELSGLNADAGGAHAAGSVALHRGAPSSADLAVSVGPGAFLVRGEASGRLSIVQAAGGPRASVRLAATGALTRIGDFIVQKGALTADGPLGALPYQLQATGFTPHGSWRASGGGTIDGTPGQYGATFSGDGRLRNADFKTLQPAVLKLGRAGSSLSLLAEVGGGRAQIDARQGAGALYAKAELSNVSLGLLDQDFTGRFDANLDLHGQGGGLAGSMQAKLAGAGERGATGQPTLDGLVNASLAGGALTIDTQLGNTQGLTSHIHVVAPVEASAAPFRITPVRTAPISGEFTADGEVRPLWDLLMGGERSLAGEVHVRGTLGGNLADPQAKGDATIAKGQFVDAETGLKLTDVALTAHLDQDAVDVSQFTGRDGATGQLSGAGRINLQRGGTSNFRLDLIKFRLLDNDIATATASGQATISRSADGAVKLTGALTIDRADVAANPPIPSGVTPMDVVEINRTPGTGGRLRAEDTHAPAVSLDVTLKAAKGVFLKGRGLNVELSLDSHVTGDTAAPRLTGTARVVRGDYDFAGKRFEFDNRSVVYLATAAEDIRLDLTATRDDPSLTAVIRIEGTAAKPKITLTSTPVLPNDEVLSQVLFGASASQLSPLDAAELASAMTAMAGGSGFDVVGNLRAFAHLDRLALGGVGTTGMTVSGGKYITDRVYLEVTGGTSGPSGAVEWRVQKNLSIVSKIAGAGGDSQVSVRWKKDY